MSKKLSLLVFCCFPFLLMGQKLTVESFDELVNSITARTNSEVDNNGKPCALVIVQVASSEAEFDDNMVVKVIPKTSEYLVYMPEGSKTHYVKTKKANELGLYDMSGNVWECCNDWYDDYRYRPQTNPTGPSEGEYRVLRGGSWFNNDMSVRVSERIGTFVIGSDCSGLRLAL